MREAELWLRERVADVPTTLLERMTAALPGSAETIPLAFVGAALGLYEAVAAGAGGREDALPLLAADALLTHAFEAQAELDPERIDDLVARCERALGEVLA